MRKTLILAAVAALTISSTGLAQDSTLWFDIRDGVSANQSITAPVYPYSNLPGALNGGMAGDAQTLFITPHFSDNFETAAPDNVGWPNTDVDGNTATGKLWLYANVNLAAAGGTGVISSIGLDMPITAPAPAKNVLGSVAYAWDGAIGWNSSVPGTGLVTGVTGAKAVKVPVSGPPPVFDATGGLVPTARYRVGALSVVGGNRNCTYATGHHAASTYTVKMAVNGLLITRVFNGASPDPTENVAFGYAAGIPEAPYVDGSVAGGTSVLPDATVFVAMKGDNTGDGRVNSFDTAPFVVARGAGQTGATQLQVFLNDFTGDRRVNSFDTSRFVFARGRTASGCGPF